MFDWSNTFSPLPSEESRKDRDSFVIRVVGGKKFGFLGVEILAGPACFTSSKLRNTVCLLCFLPNVSFCCSTLGRFPG
ncbi:hypothetical protein HanRHA438_Chr05g0246081 [Helianthus annuus]|nr:hypothetical protein HanRHA438_Chr05g0246081 [Helianthus annuus]